MILDPWHPKNGSKNAQNGSQQRTHLWPDSSVAAKLTFKQRQLWPSRIKSTVACAERSNEPSTTRTHTHTRLRSPEQKSLAGFLLESNYLFFRAPRGGNLANSIIQKTHKDFSRRCASQSFFGKTKANKKNKDTAGCGHCGRKRPCKFFFGWPSSFIKKT